MRKPIRDTFCVCKTVEVKYSKLLHVFSCGKNLLC